MTDELTFKIFEQALSQPPPTENEVQRAFEAARAPAILLTSKGLSTSVNHHGVITDVSLPSALRQLVLVVSTHVDRGELVTFVCH